uniref:Synaptonemal complex protein 1 n=1 Tax=Romanomermis culicivorax TaxID=13658 RepID=A0A915K1Z4_ROMCU
MKRNGTDCQQLETFSLKISFRSRRITAIVLKTTDGYLQPNRSGRKFPFRSVTLRRLHSVPSEKASYKLSKNIQFVEFRISLLENIPPVNFRIAMPNLSLEYQRLQEELEDDNKRLEILKKENEEYKRIYRQRLEMMKLVEKDCQDVKEAYRNVQQAKIKLAAKLSDGEKNVKKNAEEWAAIKGTMESYKQRLIEFKKKNYFAIFDDLNEKRKLELEYQKQEEADKQMYATEKKKLEDKLQIVQRQLNNEASSSVVEKNELKKQMEALKKQSEEQYKSFCSEKQKLAEKMEMVENQLRNEAKRLATEKNDLQSHLENVQHELEAKQQKFEMEKQNLGKELENVKKRLENESRMLASEKKDLEEKLQVVQRQLNDEASNSLAEKNELKKQMENLEKQLEEQLKNFCSEKQKMTEKMEMVESQLRNEMKPSLFVHRLAPAAVETVAKNPPPTKRSSFNIYTYGKGANTEKRTTLSLNKDSRGAPTPKRIQNKKKQLHDENNSSTSWLFEEVID